MVAGGRTEQGGCSHWTSSVRALVNRLHRRFAVADECITVQVLTDVAIGQAKAGAPHAVTLPPDEPAWKWLAHQVQQFTRFLEVPELARGTDRAQRARSAAYILGCVWLRGAPNPEGLASTPGLFPPTEQFELQLRVTLETVQGFIQFDWNDPQSGRHVATGRVRCTGSDVLSWELEVNDLREVKNSTHHRGAIRAALDRWIARFPTAIESFSLLRLERQPNSPKPRYVQAPPLEPDVLPWPWLVDHIKAMAEAMRFKFSPLSELMDQMDPLDLAEMERDGRRFMRKEQKRLEQETLMRENMARLAEERRRREQRAAEDRKVAEAKRAEHLTSHISNLKAFERQPLPPVPVHIEPPGLEFQETTFALGDLQTYFLRERAALWWVSNQSDDLLCLPHCRIEQLDYQLRTALRVLGPLRGRALLSDEVGLGKTIEAGLVLKELLTRGMVKRFLVLTVPSLVDQWEEELADKFGLETATTNHATARGDGQKFWGENPGLIASLHTLKQPAQLEVARQVHWDMLIVDEAHYLRNRDSQAWQAINTLPRQFLLLLTATPVQNSLEELYNLVTLLQPGQLPTPKEFRARFIDPKRPRRPRQPEELRRLLG